MASSHKGNGNGAYEVEFERSRSFLNGLNNLDAVYSDTDLLQQLQKCQTQPAVQKLVRCSTFSKSAATESQVLQESIAIVQGKSTVWMKRSILFSC